MPIIIVNNCNISLHIIIKLLIAEYGMSGEASMEGDVYSYGILLTRDVSRKETH